MLKQNTFFEQEWRWRCRPVKCSSIVYTYNNCKAKNGTFATLKMLQSYDVDVIFGPLCSTGNLFQTFFRTRVIILHAQKLY